MKVLVTGATGFIGRFLLPILRDRGFQIVVVTRNPQTAGVRLPVACEIVGWNPEQERPPEKAFRNVVAVVNLCGEGIAEGRWTRERKRRISQSRILSTRRLVEALRRLEKKPEVLVSASAIGYYGDRGNETLKESSRPGTDFLAQLCQEWEGEANQAEALGIRTVTPRIGMVLGPNGGAMEKMLPVFRLGLGGRLGPGNQWMSWIHVRDVAGIFAHAVDHPGLKGPVNAVAPNPAMNQAFTSTLGRVLHRPTLFPVPAGVLKLALGEMSQILLASQEVSAGKIRQSGYKFLYPDLETALRVIVEQAGRELVMEQWVPKPLEEVFPFFSDARNLEVLTPPFLQFKVTGVSSEPLGEGTRLDYRLKLHGIPFHWQSTITDWLPGVRFSDRQTKGPYAFWHHTHEFFERNGGTVIRDRAVYRVPLKTLGDLFLHPFIRRDLEKIFSYRRKKIDEMFCKPVE